jgi:hypothetical protein
LSSYETIHAGTNGHRRLWLPKLLDHLVGTVEKHLLDVLCDAGDLIASASLCLGFGQLLQ